MKKSVALLAALFIFQEIQKKKINSFLNDFYL